MRKLSILPLLIGIPFMILEANNLSTQRTKIIRWHKHQRTPNSIPIEAIQDESSIEICFLQKVDEQIILQVKDLQGNIIFQDVIVAPDEQETYKNLPLEYYWDTDMSYRVIKHQNISNDILMPVSQK